MDLIGLLQRPEGKTLEFKRDLSSPEKVLHTLIAFANTAGGLLVIGVENGTKRVRGLLDPLKEEERLASLISDRIAPRLIPTVDVIAWRSVQLMVVEVFPSSNRPHYLKNLGPEEGVFVRIGSINRKADAALRQELRRMASNETFDESPLAKFDSEALDFRAASESFPARGQLKKVDLQTLRLLTSHGRRLVPTVGGLLLFGRQPEQRFPDAWVQCGRFKGTDKTEITDSAECRGTLQKSLEAAYEFIKRHAMQGMAIDELKRVEQASLPLRAVRELLVNAVVHANYAQQGAPIRVSLFDDRIEIENPGVLLAGLTIDDIRQGISRLRNRVIGRVFKELGYIEQWGSGIQRASAECEAAGLAAPEFEERGFRFRVSVRLEKHRAAQMDEVDAHVRKLFAPDTRAAKNGLSTAQIATAVKLTTRSVRTRMGKLVEQGLVTVVGKNERDPQRKYYWRR
jgi:predicted HTH transcriptional regulator